MNAARADRAADSNSVGLPVVFRMPLGTRIVVSLLAAFMWLEVATIQPRSWSVVLTQGPLALGIAGGVSIAVAGSRLVIDPSGLRVQNVFVERRVAWDQMVAVSYDNGLNVVLGNRRTVGSSALGGSLLSLLVKNRRQRRAAELIEAHRSHSPRIALSDATSGAPAVSRRGAALFVLGFALYYLTGVVAFALQR